VPGLIVLQENDFASSMEHHLVGRDGILSVINDPVPDSLHFLPGYF
jgi:hypothetical protein